MKTMLIPALQGAALAITFLMFVTGVLSVISWFIPRDATDPPRGRSGLVVYTDAGTGCQYVAAGGGLFPRLGSNGQPKCKAVP